MKVRVTVLPYRSASDWGLKIYESGDEILSVTRRGLGLVPKRVRTLLEPYWPEAEAFARAGGLLPALGAGEPERAGEE